MTAQESHDNDRPLVALSPEQWRERLGEDAFRVLREAATEPPFTGAYEEVRPGGTYACRACGAELFTAAAQFDAHCGWPAFWEPSADDAVVLHEDTSLGMRRTEVRCAACDSHLGHVFRGEGFPTPTDERFCINSICLVHSDDA